MEFVLQDGLLCSASGFFIPASGSTIGDAQAIGKCSSVIYLIDYCNEAGRICNTISEISSGYVLQSTASVPLLLSPVLLHRYQYVSVLCRCRYRPCLCSKIKGTSFPEYQIFPRSVFFLDLIIAFAAKMVYYTWIFMESCFLHISFDKTDGRIYAVPVR